MKKGLKILLIVALAICTSAAWARTPDGQTPSEETVCDGLPGPLFGLCNAYCEAMDCDSPEPHASPQACARVLNNYLNKSGGEDPPCLGASDCCEQPGTGTNSCDDTECVDIVCEIDSFCCEVEWDDICVDEANDLCPVCGGSPGPPLPQV